MAKLKVKFATETAPVVPVFNPAVLDKSTVDAIRTFYSSKVKDDNEQPMHTQLSDDAIWAIFAPIKQQYPAASNDDNYLSCVTRMVEAANADNGPIVDDTKPLDSASQTFVDILMQDTALNTFISDAVNARTILQSVDQQLIVRLLTDCATVGNRPWELGMTGNFLAPTIDALSPPGTKAPKDYEGDTLLYDIHSAYVNGKRKPVSRYREMARRLPEGQRIMQEIAWCEKPKEGPYSENTAEYISGHKIALEGHLSDLVGWLRSAVSIIRQMQAVNKMTKLHCYLMTEENTLANGSGETVIQLTPGNNKMWIAERREGGKREMFTLTAFMGFRPTIAEENGGTLGELKKSTPAPDAREPGSGQGNVTPTNEPWTMLNFAPNMERSGMFLNNDALQIGVRRLLNDPDHTKSDAMLKGMAETLVGLIAIFTTNQTYMQRGDALIGESIGTIEQMLMQKTTAPTAASAKMKIA